MGAHCSQHGTGTTTCSGHRASCSTNRALSFQSLASSGKITATDINALRISIRDEIARYNLHRSFSVTARQSTAYTTSTLVDNAHINDMEIMAQTVNNISEPVGGSYAVFTTVPNGTQLPNSYANASQIEYAHWGALLAKYNLMRQDCICNADCACNLVCNCHNDCGCNYSDCRLKENVQYIKTKFGIKWYIFTYVWDSTVLHLGAMAQELLGTEYSALVSTDGEGFLKVDYSKLPFNLNEVLL